MRHPVVLSLPSFASLAALAPLLVACGASNATTDTTPKPPPVEPVASAAPAAPSGPAKPDYPPTMKQPVVDLYRDVRLTDDYRWLEDWNDLNVKAWSDAENAFTRKALDAIQARGAIHTRLEQLMSDASPSWTDVVASKGEFLALEARPPKQHPSLVVLTSLGDLKTERTLVDPNALDPSGATAIGWFFPSPDGKRVAVSLSKGGGERGDVHVYDVANGKEAKDVVPQSDGAGNGSALAWKGDGSGFFYTHAAREADAPKDGDYQRVYFHKLGDPVTKDALAVGKDGPAIAQWEVKLGEDGRSIVARMEYGDGGEYDQWLLGAAGKWISVATRAEAVKQMDVGADGALYLLSAKGAPKHKVLRTSVKTASLDKAEVIAPEGDGVIEAFLPLKSRMYVVEIVGGPSRIRSISLAPKAKAAATAIVATPPVSAVVALSPAGADDAIFGTQSFTEPLGWYRVTAGVPGKVGAPAGEPTVTKTALVATSVADFKDIEVTREECTSKDGTKVPMTVLKAKSVAADGSAPALLTGYGGFGVTTPPRFRPSWLAWLEQGGIYGIANVRGGGEMGEEWHRAGNLANKQNVFDDFYACAQHLVDAKDTTPARLAIEGGSNGGLLMGAELTQHPEAFKAVVSHVGIYDMLRVERDANGRFNVTEYGSVTEPKEFDALYAYSPYHHVKDGVAYPATLFMTGANDPRVAPYHSRKMTARLQAATSSDAPILLRTSANTGHGHGSPLGAQIEEQTDVLGFLVQQLGVTYATK